MNFEIPCLFCPDMIGSGEEMKVLREGDDGAILAACHPDCFEREMAICIEKEKPYVALGR